MKVYPQDINDKLELNKVLQYIAQYAMGEAGHKAVLATQVYTDPQIIERLLTEVSEWKSAIEAQTPIPFGQYEDISPDLYYLSKEGYVLEVESIQRIKALTLIGYEISFYFKDFTKQKNYPLLYQICELIHIDEALAKEIDRVLDDEGNIRPDASKELLRISKAIGNKEREIDKIFKAELTRFGKSNLLAENQESMRNGRRVLTVPAEHKRRVGGIIHDESSTGKMVYIEPEQTVSINNDLQSLHGERRQEIRRIVRALCAYIRPHRKDLEHLNDTMIRLDVIRSKATFAKVIDGQKPNIVASSKIDIKEGYNPILLIKSKTTKEKIIPFTLRLNRPIQILILSGPNAGGKSVTMKSVGLLQLMVQSGILPSSDTDSTYGIFKEVFADIGDQQSVEDDLSTYSSHLKNMKFILDNATKRSLILIDEFGSGTDPKIGGAIAEAILHEINKKQAYGVVTTHYSNLKHYAYKMKGLINGSMEFDTDKLNPTYQLIVGRPGSSFAYEIAQKTGLPNIVISNAKKRSGKNENALEKMLIELQDERREIEIKMAEIIEKEETVDRLMKNYNQLHNELEFQRKKLKLDRKEAHLYQSSQEARELQKLIKELRKSKDLEKAEQAAKKIKKEKKQITQNIDHLKSEVFETVTLKKGDIKEGAFVKVRNTDSVGKIVKVEKDRVELEMGFLKVFVDKRDLVPAKEPINTHKRKSVDTSKVSGIGGHFETKLDIRGYKLDDAMWFVEEFIDRAIMNNAFELKIIHGVGNGVLKKNVHKKLREYDAISKVWHPEDEFGGEGVTLVRI